VLCAGIQVSNDECVHRLGKDEKLAKEAGIPFNVKVIPSLESSFYFVVLEDIGWPAHG
jgi:hypothetical protein